jgi:hypothetical protein
MARVPTIAQEDAKRQEPGDRHSPSPGRSRRVPFNGPKRSDPVARATEPTAEERADESAAVMMTSATAVRGLRGGSGPSISSHRIRGAQLAHAVGGCKASRN